VAQTTVSLSDVPQLVSVGEGAAMIGAVYNQVKYLIGSTNSAPDTSPFIVNVGQREPMNLRDGEGLWVFGHGLATIFTDNDPT
jgi:hypothetical protein